MPLQQRALTARHLVRTPRPPLTAALHARPGPGRQALEGRQRRALQLQLARHLEGHRHVVDRQRLQLPAVLLSQLLVLGLVLQVEVHAAEAAAAAGAAGQLLQAGGGAAWWAEGGGGAWEEDEWRTGCRDCAIPLRSGFRYVRTLE